MQAIQVREFGGPRVLVPVEPGLMADVALTRVARLQPGESILIHDGLGAFAAAFPGIAKQLGASRIVGTVRAGRPSTTRLPYDELTTTVAGFNAGAYLPAHPEAIPPSAEAALSAVANGLADVEIDFLPLAEAATAHERLENHTTRGRLMPTVN